LQPGGIRRAAADAASDGRRQPRKLDDVVRDGHPQAHARRADAGAQLSQADSGVFGHPVTSMGRWGRLTKLLLLAIAALVVTASSGNAASAPHGRKLGVVRHAGGPRALPRSAALSTAAFLTFDANYESLINRYFADVEHDSGGIANVY